MGVFNCISNISFFYQILMMLKKSVEEEIEDYYELIGVRKIALIKN